MGLNEIRAMRERAASERLDAECENLPNVRERGRRSAQRWADLADIMDRASPGRPR